MLVNFYVLSLIEWIAAVVLVISALSALFFWKRESHSRVENIIEKANAELEGRRMIEEGWKALKSGSRKQAERLLKAAVRTYNKQDDPTLISYARYQLALLYKRIDKLNQAIQALEPTVKLKSTSPQHYLYLSRLYERAGRLNRAKWALKMGNRQLAKVDGFNERLKLLKEGTNPGFDTPQSNSAFNSSLKELTGIKEETAEELLNMGFDDYLLLANAKAEDLVKVSNLRKEEAEEIIEKARKRTTQKR